MKSKQDQNKLVYLLQQFGLPKQFPTLRAIMAYWGDNVLHITFFFSKELTDDVKENASILASEIIAQYTDGFLEEKYLHLEDSQNLPISPFWVYIKPDKNQSKPMETL